MKSLAKFFVTVALLLPSMVHSGRAIDSNVVIDLVERTAQGILTTARFSEDPEEFIGCGVRYTVTPTGLSSFGACQANVSPDNFVFCVTTDPELVDKIAGLNHYSFVDFRWDENDECIFFGFSTQSFNIPENVGETPDGDDDD